MDSSNPTGDLEVKVTGSAVEKVNLENLAPYTKHMAGLLEITKLNNLQQVIFPHIERGHDVEIVGGGKHGRSTGVLLSVTSVLAMTGAPGNGPRAVYICATREAAWDMYHKASTMAGPLRVHPLIGGSGVNQDTDCSLFDVVIATPGLVLGAIQKGLFNTPPAGLQYIIFDHAHQLLQSSGTGGHCRNIGKLLLSPSVCRVVISNTPIPTVSEYVRQGHVKAEVVGTKVWTYNRWVEVKGDRYDLLSSVITKNCPTEQCLVIVPTFPIGRHIQEALQKALGEHRANIFGKAQPQGDRNSILADFNDKKLQVLITCKLGLLGVKLADVGTIVFYEPPEDWGLAFSAMHQCGISSYCFVHVLYDPDSEREIGLKKVMDDNHRALRGGREDDIYKHIPLDTESLSRPSCNPKAHPSRKLVAFDLPLHMPIEEIKHLFDKTMRPTEVIQSRNKQNQPAARWFLLFDNVPKATLFLYTFDKSLVQGRMIRLGYAPHRERRR